MRYPIIEAATAILTALILARFGMTWPGAIGVVLTMLLMLIVVI